MALADCFSPLARLTGEKYIKGIPSDSRRSEQYHFGPYKMYVTLLIQATALAKIARERGQSLAQMAIQWVLRKPAITSALIGASRPEQIEEIINGLSASTFSDEELKSIDLACGI